MKNENKYEVKVLEKALKILNCFTVQRPEWTINDFCTDLNLNRTTVYRIITTLKSYHYVSECEKSGKYKLGKAFIVNGSVMLNEMDLKKKAGPFLEKLAIDTGETASLSIYYDFSSMIIDNYESLNDIKVHVSIGKRSELHATAHGKIFLSSLCDNDINKYLEKDLPKYTQQTNTDHQEIWEHINEIKKNKVAYDLQELVNGIYGIAAPIFGYNNKIIAAISIVGPKSRVEVNWEDIEQSVKTCATLISQEMGYLGE